MFEFLKKLIFSQNVDSINEQTNNINTIQNKDISIISEPSIIQYRSENQTKTSKIEKGSIIEDLMGCCFCCSENNDDYDDSDNDSYY
jgi:hypothetical protein